MTTEFDRAMSLMRRHDPQQAEDGFGQLAAIAADHVDDLIAAFHTETHHGLRCWLLELIGHAASPQALPLLNEQVWSTDESLRDWAAAGLHKLGTREARQVLYRARVNGHLPPAP